VSESDGKVSAAYRSLAREEPSASLDAAILSASRGALARPSASRRWAAPVSIAAVLVLAFGVTLRMQQEKPGVESPDMDATHSAQGRVVPAAPPAADVPEAKAVQQPAPPMKQSIAPREEARAKKVVPSAKPDKVEADRALRDEVRVQSERKDLKEPRGRNRAREGIQRGRPGRHCGPAAEASIRATGHHASGHGSTAACRSPRIRACGASSSSRSGGRRASHRRADA
jgi:hypothetical protein